MSIEFVKNFDDLSTEKGFQFRFHCDKCGNGFLSEYATNKLGVAGSFLNAAGSFFGGVTSNRKVAKERFGEAFSAPIDVAFASRGAAAAVRRNPRRSMGGMAALAKADLRRSIRR